MSSCEKNVCVYVCVCKRTNFLESFEKSEGNEDNNRFTPALNFDLFRTRNVKLLQTVRDFVGSTRRKVEELLSQEQFKCIWVRLFWLFLLFVWIVLWIESFASIKRTYLDDVFVQIDRWHIYSDVSVYSVGKCQDLVNFDKESKNVNEWTSPTYLKMFM